MQYAGSYTVAGLHLPCNVLSLMLWRVPAMQSILTRTQCAKDDEEEQELDCGGQFAMQYAESYTVAG